MWKLGLDVWLGCLLCTAAVAAVPAQVGVAKFPDDTIEVEPGMGLADVRVVLDSELAVIVGPFSGGMAQGMASVLERDGAAFERQRFLMGSRTHPHERMGQGGVALSGTRLALSTPMHRPAGSVTPKGIVYVRERQNGLWVEVAALERFEPDPPQLNLQDITFGWGVGFSGDDLLVTGQSDLRGVSLVWVFRRLAGVWTPVQRLDMPPLYPYEANATGTSLAIDGNRAALGGGNSKVVRIIERDPHGVWHLAAVVHTPSPQLRDLFGISLALEGDLLAVGAPRMPVYQYAPGRVHLYRLQGGAWQFEQTVAGSDGTVIWVPTNGHFNDDFGVSVALQEGRLVVGAPSTRPLPVVASPGQAYIFERGASGWEETWRLMCWAGDPSPFGARMGKSVAIDGDVVLAGAEEASQPHHRRGATAVFRLPFGDVVCDGQANSTGVGANLTCTGDRRVGRMDLRIEVEGLPPNTFGYLLASRQPGFVAHPAGSQGNLCLSGSIARFISSASAADATGRTQVEVGLDRIPTVPQSAVAPGDRWTFQFWYRDLVPGPSSNFSSAREVTFR